jgi:arylsulfatase A-like enzyme
MAPDAPAGTTVTGQVQMMDLAPTILSFAGLEIPVNFEAQSLAPYLRAGDGNAMPDREYAYAELGRDHIQSSAEHIIMRRDKNLKYVIYPGTPDGEIYDLAEDPGETRNLWHDPAWRERRNNAVSDILGWSVLGAYRGNRRPTPKPQVPMQLPAGAPRQ